MATFATYTFATMLTVTYIGQLFTGANANPISISFAAIIVLVHYALTNKNDSE
jgi:hypothetical protein